MGYYSDINQNCAGIIARGIARMRRERDASAKLVSRAKTINVVVEGPTPDRKRKYDVTDAQIYAAYAIRRNGRSVAVELGCTDSFVFAALRRHEKAHGLPRISERKGWSQEEFATAIQMRKDGRRLREIADVLNCSIPQVSKQLGKARKASA